MKKRIILLLAGTLLMLATGAMATTYNFSTSNLSSADKTTIMDMADTTSIVWNLHQSLSSNETITSASLTISSLYNWEHVSADKLYVNLINTSAGSNTLSTYTPDPSDTTNYFTGKGVLLTTADGGTYYPNHAANLVYNFTSFSALQADLADGYFGFGFDPDCHWYDNGITFTFTTTTAPVPEPGTIALFGLGLAGLAIFGKRRVKKQA